MLCHPCVVVSQCLKISVKFGVKRRKFSAYLSNRLPDFLQNYFRSRAGVALFASY